METKTTLPDDELVDKLNDELDDLDDELDDECVEYIPYEVEMYEAISPILKKFLVDYCGPKFYKLEADIYREIEEIIKENFIFASCIPDIFHTYRTIKDNDAWYEAMDNYELKDAKFNWQPTKHWYDNKFPDDDDDEEFLDDIPDEELTDDQKKAIEFVAIADKIRDIHIGFADFMKKGCDLLIPAMQKFMEDTASFDLTVLSVEGYDQVQISLDTITDFLLDPLYALLNNNTE